MTIRALAALLLLAGRRAEPAVPQAPPLAGASIGGGFSFVHENGRAVTERDYAGKYRMIYFGYTFCPDVCPVDMANLMQGFRLFEQRDRAAAARVQPLFVSIDPERDTPAVVKAFTDNFHPRLIGLTGTPEQVATAAKAHAIYYRKEGEPNTKDYLVSHSNVTYLIGPDGEPIAPVPQDLKPADIAATLAQWVR